METGIPGEGQKMVNLYMFLPRILCFLRGVSEDGMHVCFGKAGRQAGRQAGEWVGGRRSDSRLWGRSDVFWVSAVLMGDHFKVRMRTVLKKDDFNCRMWVVQVILV